jgi:hypothetical protein
MYVVRITYAQSKKDKLDIRLVMPHNKMALTVNTANIT